MSTAVHEQPTSRCGAATPKACAPVASAASSFLPRSTLQHASTIAAQFKVLQQSVFTDPNTWAMHQDAPDVRAALRAVQIQRVGVCHLTCGVALCQSRCFLTPTAAAQARTESIQAARSAFSLAGEDQVCGDSRALAPTRYAKHLGAAAWVGTWLGQCVATQVRPAASAPRRRSGARRRVCRFCGWHKQAAGQNDISVQSVSLSGSRSTGRKRRHVAAPAARLQTNRNGTRLQRRSAAGECCGSTDT